MHLIPQNMQSVKMKEFFSSF